MNRPAALPGGLAERLRMSVLVATAFLLMSVWAVAMLVVAVATLFQAPRLYSEVMAKGLGRAILRLFEIRMVVRQSEPFPSTQVVYIANHTSLLDGIMLISLGLPRTRFFIRGGMRKVLPLAVIGQLIGIFWTVPQKYQERRVRIFQRAARILRRSGESVFLSPEGIRNTTGEIAHFNKGAFHLATSLSAPIVPLYLELPAAIGYGYQVGSGTVTVHVFPAISTDDWRVEDVERNAAAVRDFYLRVHAEKTGRASPSEAA